MWWDWMRRAREAGVVTIEGIMVRYGGSSQVEKYREYARTIAGWMGVSSSLEIDIDDDASLLPFAKALFRYEAGRVTPLSDEQIIYGFDYARAGFKEPARDDPQPDDDPTDEPVRDDEPKSIDGALAALKAEGERHRAAIDAAVADIKELARVANQPQPQLDWGKILQPILAELAPKILPMLMPLIVQMLPQLLPYLLDAFFKPRQSVMSNPNVKLATTGGISAVLGGLLTAFLSGKVPQ